MHVLRVVGESPNIQRATVFNPGVGLDSVYMEEVLTNACGYSSKCGFLPRKKQKQEKSPLCDKLYTHKCHGDSPNPAKGDPVSILAGGLGAATYNYEGPGIPNSFSCHTIWMFKMNVVARVQPKGAFPKGRQLQDGDLLGL